MVSACYVDGIELDAIDLAHEVHDSGLSLQRSGRKQALVGQEEPTSLRLGELERLHDRSTACAK